MSKYTINQTFGIDEIPPQDCPTYIDRPVHDSFKYNITHEKQHLIIFGASKQGKSWLVEKYCPSFLRIGCHTSFNLHSILKHIMEQLGLFIGNIQKTSIEETTESSELGSKVSGGLFGVLKGGISEKQQDGEKSTSAETLSYNSIDIEDLTSVIKAIKDRIENNFIVIENFHYLKQEIQYSFAMTLREFLYYDIRFIIIGIWKDNTKLTTMVPDLAGRIIPLDIGDWEKDELIKVTEKGSNALNIKFSSEIIDYLTSKCGRNIGIFKLVLKQFCMFNGVYETQEEIKTLDNLELAKNATVSIHRQLIGPLIERIDFLAGAKEPSDRGVRYFLIKAIMEIIAESPVNELLNGINRVHIIDKIAQYGEYSIEGHIKYQLRNIHKKEELPSHEHTTIPLFYYDESRDRLFIVESSLLCAANSETFDLKTILGPQERYIKNARDN